MSCQTESTWPDGTNRSPSGMRVFKPLTDEQKIQGGISAISLQAMCALSINRCESSHQTKISPAGMIVHFIPAKSHK